MGVGQVAALAALALAACPEVSGFALAPAMRIGPNGRGLLGAAGYSSSRSLPARGRLGQTGAMPLEGSQAPGGQKTDMNWVASSSAVSAMESTAQPQQGGGAAGLEDYVGKLVKIENAAAWEDLMAAHKASGALLVAEFRAQFCRKCMAIKHKYKSFPAKYAGRPVIFAEIDAHAVGKEVRTKLGVKQVPLFTFWSFGEMKEQYLSGKDISECIGEVNTRVQRLIQDHDETALAHVVATPVAEAVVEEMVQDEVVAEDCLGAAVVCDDAMSLWRQQQAKSQSRVVHAPGVSKSQTLLRTSAGEQVAADDQSVSEAATELRLELERGEEEGQGSEAEGGGAAGDFSRPSSKEVSNGGGNSAEELLAQLEAIAAKKGK